MSQNLNKAIGYCMHALKRAEGADKAELQRAMLYFNSARNMVKAGDQELAHTLISKSIEILESLERVNESGAIPADRLARAASGSDTSAGQRNAWMGHGRARPNGEAAPTMRSDDVPLTPSRPSKPAFGKRKG